MQQNFGWLAWLIPIKEILILRGVSKNRLMFQKFHTEVGFR